MPAVNTARLHRIDALIHQGGHVGFKHLSSDLEVSTATLKRDLEFLRSRIGAPIKYDALPTAQLVFCAHRRKTR